MATTTTWAPELTRAAAPRRTRWRPGALPALGLVVAGVVALWWTGTPAAAGATPGGMLTSLGELAGLLASALVCAQLLLVGRVPWFERAVGFDRLVAWHRSLGTSVVLLVLTHVALMIVGGSLLDGLTLWSEVPDVLARQPYLWPALVGTVLFVGVGLSSARLARERLSYEAWFAVHLTVYAGVYLAFAHQLAGGSHFVDSPVARVLWILLYAGTAAALLTWRVVLPLLEHRRLALRVSAVVPEAHGLTSVWVEGRGVATLGARGGQFFLVRFLARGHRATAHPYSLSVVPRGDRLRFTVGALGDHSSAVTHLRPGTRVQVEGPFGRFTADRATNPAVLLVAGGAGVGPVRALAEDLLARGHELVVVHRAHDESGLALRDEFTPSPRLRYVPVPGRRAQLGYDPLDPAHLRALVPDIASRDVFTCGPPAMTQAVVRSARALGVPRAAIHHEEIES